MREGGGVGPNNNTNPNYIQRIPAVLSPILLMLIPVFLHFTNSRASWT